MAAMPVDSSVAWVLVAEDTKNCWANARPLTIRFSTSLFEYARKGIKNGRGIFCAKGGYVHPYIECKSILYIPMLTLSKKTGAVRLPPGLYIPVTSRSFSIKSL